MDALTARLVAGGWIQVRAHGLHVLHTPVQGKAERWLCMQHLDLLADVPANAGSCARYALAADRIGAVWGLLPEGAIEADTAAAYLVEHVPHERLAQVMVVLMGRASIPRAQRRPISKPPGGSR